MQVGGPFHVKSTMRLESKRKVEALSSSHACTTSFEKGLARIAEVTLDRRQKHVRRKRNNHKSFDYIFSFPIQSTLDIFLAPFLSPSRSIGRPRAQKRRADQILPADSSSQMICFALSTSIVSQNRQRVKRNKPRTRAQRFAAAEKYREVKTRARSRGRPEVSLFAKGRIEQVAF